MTRPTSLVFPFHFAEVERLGKLFYPIIQVQLKTLWGWQTFDFLVDTGADITTLPSFAFALFGFKKDALTKSTTYGLAGIAVDTWSAQIPVRLGTWQFPIQTAVTGENTTPLLLGKKDVFDTRFSLHLDSVKQQTVLVNNRL